MPPANGGGPAPVPRRFFVALALAACMPPLNSTMIAVALPAIGAEFAAEPSQVTQLLVTSYLVASLILQSPGGKIGDLWGRQAAMRAGRLLFLAGSLAGVLIHHLWGLAGARLAMAVGGALLLPAAMATLRTLVPPERRGRMFGILGAVLGLAAAIGPPLGGWLTQHLGWSAVFWINVPVILLSAALGSGVKLDDSQSTRERPSFDLPGVLMLGATLLCASALTQASRPAIPLLTVAAVLGFALFLWWERRVAEPVLDIRMFRRLPFSAGVVVLCLQNFGMYAVLFQLPYLLTELQSAGSATTGQMLLGMTGGMVLFSPLGGRIADHYGARYTVFAGSLLGLGGLLALSAPDRWQSVGTLLPWLIVVGAGMGFSIGPAQAAALGAIDSRDSGMAAGALSMMRYVGSVSGISLLGVLLADSSLPPVERYRSGFLIYAAAYGVAALVALALPRHGAARETPRPTK